MKWRIQIDNLIVIANILRYFFSFVFAVLGILGLCMFGELNLSKIIFFSSSIFLALLLFFFSAFGRRFFRFLKESYAELKCVSWPNRKEVIQMTGIIFVFVVIVGLFIGILDKVIEFLLYRLLLGWK